MPSIAEHLQSVSGGAIAQYRLALSAQAGGPQFNVPGTSQGHSWERFIFHCKGCLVQNEQLLKVWATTVKADWERESQTNFENKSKEHIRRCSRIAESGISNEQLGTFTSSFEAFSMVLPGIVKLNEAYWGYLSRPTVANGDMALEKAVAIEKELNESTKAAGVWKQGQYKPPAQQELMQDLKMSYACRECVFSPKAIMLHVDADLCENLLPCWKSRCPLKPTQISWLLHTASNRCCEVIGRQGKCSIVYGVQLWATSALM